MLDPSNVGNDRLRNTERWGYTGEIPDDPVQFEESSSVGPWLLGAALLIIAVIVAIAFFGAPM